MNLNQQLNSIHPVNTTAMAEAQKRWDAIAKPLGSLGLLEKQVVRMAGMVGTASLSPFHKTALVVMCADNGVVEEAVTQTGQEVTAIVSENMSVGSTCVCQMAKLAGVTVIPVDIGVATPLVGENILQKNIRRGTANLCKQPAMTLSEAEKGITVGIELVGQLKQQGYELIATGEMGIGNTTTASAVSSVLLGKSPHEMTGTGAGLSSEGLQRKITAIETAISVNQPNSGDPLDVLHKVGGLDIAGLTGVFLGAAIHRLPVLVDGVISMTAALVAIRLCPTVKDYLIGSHATTEPSGKFLLEELEIDPFLFAKMRLGEGTGGVAVVPILQMALAVYAQMSTFDDNQIEAYKPL